MTILFRRWAAAAVVAVVLAGLSACSSGTPSASPSRAGGLSPGSGVTSTVTSTASPSSDVCVLIPSATVATAFGGNVTRSQAGQSLSNPACGYLLDRSNLGVTGTVEIINLVIYNAQKYETAKQTGLSSGNTLVSGVADGAYYDPQTTAAVLHKGDTVYYVAGAFTAPVGVVLDAAKIKADIIALAQAVAAKL